MPKKGPDIKKLEKIVKIIKSTKTNGIWIRELARQTSLPLSTIHLYLYKFLKNQVKIETVKIGKFTHSQMKIVKLRCNKW
jgi:hypothetical protein